MSAAAVDGRILGILHHTLGVSNPNKPEDPPYRNHFVLGDGHSDMTVLSVMVERGLMARRCSALPGGDWVFHATDDGVRLALQTRPRASKRRQRYSRFLVYRDALPDLTFKEFLTSPDFAEARR